MSDQCGSVNPMAGLAQGTADMAANLQEARMFQGGSKGAHMGGPGPGGVGDMLYNRQGGGGHDADAFMKEMRQHGGPQHPGMFQGPPPPAALMHRQPPPGGNMDGNLMAREFHQHQRSAADMNHMAEEFERMMVNGPPPSTHGGPQHNMVPMAPHQWVHDFHQRQHPPMGGPGPSVAAHPTHAVRHAAMDPTAHGGMQMHSNMQQQWADMYGAAIHGPGPMMYQANHMAPMGFGPAMQSMAPMPPTMMHDAQGTQWAEQFHKEAKEAESVVQEPVTDTADPNAVEAKESTGGLDQQMIEQFLNSSNPKYRNSKFIKFLDRVNKGELAFVDNQVVETGISDEKQREAEWAEQYGETLNPRQQAAEAWANEFGDYKEAMREAYGPEAEAWATEFDPMNYGGMEQDMDFDLMEELTKVRQMGQDANRDPEYAFQQDNPFNEHKDPFSEGIRLMREGSLKEAILAFEAAVQQDPEHAEAWKFLGQVQAENEQEAPAIAALLKAVSVDPYNLDALLMLGVSYTNDLEEARALNYLKTWLEHNPDFHGALSQQQNQVREYEQMYMSDATHMIDNHLYQQVVSMFLSAAQLSPQDADLHTVLGVLYHISSDFDKAIESFQRAVDLRPNDPYLWNKLGATQANSSRSEQAVHAYDKALSLKPNYVRAHANRAIAFANQGLHREACSAYLKTLSLNSDAEHLWSYLRISLSHIKRDDLLQLANKRDTNLFKEHIPF